MSNRTCSIESCERKYYSLDLCKLHYTRMKRHGDPLTKKYREAEASDKEPCIIDGCDKPYLSRKMCAMHYQRWRRNGDASFVGTVYPVGCIVDACAKPHYGHGLCIAHFTRRKRHGSATARLQGEVVNDHKICSQCNRDLPIKLFREGRGECRICSKKYIHARRALVAAVESDDYKPHQVFIRDGWICQLCQEPIDESLRWPHRYSASVDHILPLSLGGTDTLQNVQSAHLTCNISKGARVA